MTRKRNAPGHKAEGVECLHCRADIDAYNTQNVQVQYLIKLGVPVTRAATIASLCFEEIAHA